MAHQPVGTGFSFATSQNSAGQAFTVQSDTIRVVAKGSGQHVAIGTTGPATTADPYIGKYYSVDYIRRKILRQTDEELVEQNKLIKAEKEAGIILPTEQEMMLAAQLESAASKNLGKPPSEPDIDDTGVEAPESPGVPKGGEI